MAQAISFRVRSVHNNNGGDSVFQPQMFSVLDEYLQPGSTTQAAKVAAALNALVPIRENVTDQEQTVEAFLWETWGLLLELAQQVPHEHPGQDRLVRVVQELVSLPAVKIVIWNEELLLWKDVPILGASAREAWIEPGEAMESKSPKQYEHWVNYNSFLARLLGSGIATWGNFAVWAMTDAHETPDKSFSTCTHNPRWQTSLLAATQWIEYAGEVFATFIEPTTATSAETEPNKPRLDPKMIRAQDLYPGDKQSGATWHRWEFWQSRFAEVASASGVDETIAAAAGRAAEKMTEVSRK